MLLRLQTAADAMATMVRNQERTANNLANANTIGYKADRSFVQALNDQIDADGSPTTDLIVRQWIDLNPGALDQTGNPLDVALAGDGFFVVADEATGDVRYTRAGRFTLDNEGFLRTPGGHLVEGAEGPIHVPPGASPIEITGSGTIRAGSQTVGSLQVVRFADPNLLLRTDASTFRAADAVPEPVDEPVVRQGFLETSNVDPITEMAAMIHHFRLFESQQKALQSADQVLGQITSDLGKF